jgi:hypothetical protein
VPGWTEISDKDGLAVQAIFAMGYVDALPKLLKSFTQCVLQNGWDVFDYRVEGSINPHKRTGSREYGTGGD